MIDINYINKIHEKKNEIEKKLKNVLNKEISLLKKDEKWSYNIHETNQKKFNEIKEILKNDFKNCIKFNWLNVDENIPFCQDDEDDSKYYSLKLDFDINRIMNLEINLNYIKIENDNLCFEDKDGNKVETNTDNVIEFAKNNVVKLKIKDKEENIVVVTKVYEELEFYVKEYTKYKNLNIKYSVE